MPAAVPVLGQIALNLAMGVGASLLANAIRPQRTQARVTASRGLSFEMTLGESVPVSAVWGRGRAAGHLTFAQEYGPNNEWLKFKIDCGRGWYDALEGVTADEELLTLTGSNDGLHGRVVEEYRDPDGNPRMWIKAYTGEPGQPADAGLIAAAPTRWGEAHTATATPYIIVTLHYHADLFPNASLPRFGPIWRGLRQYDWRKDSTMPGGDGTHRWNDQSTWEWTENPAVLAWNWRRGHWRNGVKVMGMGFSRWANDLAYFTAAANLCDEPVYYADSEVTLARYAFGREIGDDEAHLDVLRELEQSWCGASFDRGGAYAPVPAASHIPVMTLRDRDRLSGAPVIADMWGTVSEKRTRVHGSFGSVADNFVPTPYGMRIDLDLEALTRGPKVLRLDQPYEHRPERAQMRAEIALRRNRFGAKRTETFAPVAAVLEAGDAIIRECEWGAVLMIIESIGPSEDRLGHVITMVGWDNAIVPDTDAGFLDLPNGPGIPPVAPARTLQVQGLNVEPYSRGGDGEPYARASWTPVTDPNCDQVMVRVWPESEDESEAEDFFADALRQSSISFGPLMPATIYKRKALVTRRDGRQTFWTSEGTFNTTPAPRISGNRLDAAINARLQQIVEQVPSDITVLREQIDDLSASLNSQVSTILERMGRINIGVGARYGENKATAELALDASATATSAISQFLVDLFAVTPEGEAQVMFRAIAATLPEGALANVALQVGAGSEVAWAQSALELAAFYSEDLGLHSRLRLIADQIDFIVGGTTLPAYLLAVQDEPVSVPVVSSAVQVDLSQRRLIYQTVLSSGATMLFPAGARPGFEWRHIIEQDGVGGHELLVDSDVFVGGEPTISTDAGAVTVLDGLVIGLTPPRAMLTARGGAMLGGAMFYRGSWQAYFMGTSRTFSSVPIGEPRLDRLVVVAVATADTGRGWPSWGTNAGVTIGGVAATRVAPVSAGVSGVAIYQRLVPAGETTDVAVTVPNEEWLMAIHVYTMERLTNNAPHNVAVDSSTGNRNSASVTINVPARGLMIAASWHHSGSGATWTGAAEDADLTIPPYNPSSSAASLTLAEGQVGRTVTVSGSGNNYMALAVATWS